MVDTHLQKSASLSRNKYLSIYLMAFRYFKYKEVGIGGLLFTLASGFKIKK